MHRLLAIITIALLAGLAAPFTASADVHFGAPLSTTLSTPGKGGRTPAVAGNAAGVVSAAYLEKVGAVVHPFVRVKPAGSTAFGPAHELTTTASGEVDTAVAADGTVTVVWQELSACVGSKVFVATAPPGGSFGPAIKISDNAYVPELAVAPDGTVFVLYTHDNGSCGHEVHVQVRPRQGSTVDTPISDPAYKTTDAGVASIGVDGSGTAIAAFTQNLDVAPFSNVLRVARRPAGGAWTTATLPGPDTNGAALGVSTDGHAVVAYNAKGTAGYTVDVRSLAPGANSFGGPQTVTNASVNHVVSGLAVADGGVAVVTTTGNAVARRAAGAATFGSATDLGLPSISNLIPALTSGGDLALLDIEKLPGSNRFSLVSRVEPKGGTLGPPQATGLDSDATGTPVAAAFGANDLVVGWNPRPAGASEFETAVALGDGNPPASGPASAPGDGAGSAAATAPPAAKLAVRITKPRRGTRARKLRSLRGTASGPVSRVEVSVVRVLKPRARTARARCRTLGASGRLATKTRIASRTGCALGKLLKATGKTRWTLKLRHRLPAGTYVVFARARSASGTKSKVARAVIKLR